MCSDDGSPQADIEGHPRRDDLARLVRMVVLTAADEGHARFGDGLDEVMADKQLGAEDGLVGSCDLIQALSGDEPPILRARRVVALLLARGINLELPTDDTAAARLSQQLCWLAAHTWIDVLCALAEGLDEPTGAWAWNALAGLIRHADRRGTPNGRAEALAAVALLSASSHPAAKDGLGSLEGQLRDGLLIAALPRNETTSSTADNAEAADDDEAAHDDEAAASATSLTGELVPAPLGPIALVLWTVTGLIVVRHLFRFIANVILRCKRPTQITVVNEGVTVAAKLDVLGRTLRCRQTHIPIANLAQVVREVRYPRIALYAGLLTLALGTYLGTLLIADGGRAGSPSLLALGAAIFGAGVALDLIFANLLLGGRRKHRLLFVPRKGRVVAIVTEDQRAVERAVKRLARTT